MVERMVSSKLSKYGLGNNASIINSSDNRPVSVNDTTVKNVQNDNKHGPPQLFEDLASQKEEVVTQAFQAKSPPGNLVYARRKSETDLSNSRPPDKNPTNSPQQGNDCASIPVDSVATRITNCENEQSAMPAMEHWNVRFAHLQRYLQQCNTSNQEVYLQKLRSFSPDECNRHAVELEKRAIRLMVDEGKEIQRVKVLNVVGKSGGNHLLLSSVSKSDNLV